MTTCPECGHSNMPGVAFCDDCGHDLSTVSVTTAAVPSASTNPEPVSTLDTSSQTPVADPFGDPFGDPFATSSVPDTAVSVHEVPVNQADAAAPASHAPALPVSPMSIETTISTATLKIERNGRVGYTFDVTNPTTIGKWDMDSGNFPELDATDHDPDGYISRKHAVIEQHNGQWTITDLGSTNGTALNRQKLAPHQPQPLNSGDELIVGRLFLRFHN